MSPSDGLASILVEAGIIDGTSGWSSQVGGLTNRSREVVFIDSGGKGGEVKVAIDYPSVQIIVQGSSTAGGYTEAHDKAIAIRDCLQAVPTPNEAYEELVSCVSVNYPAWLGKSDSDQPRFSLNFNLITAPINQGHRTY